MNKTAEKLINSFINVLGSVHTDDETDRRNAKQCALVAIRFALKHCDKRSMFHLEQIEKEIEEL